MQNIKWNDISYNLYYNYTKKELRTIYRFLKNIYKKAKRYNKRKNLKIQVNLSLIIKETAVYIGISNNEKITNVDTEVGEVEINVKFINSMFPKKINQLNNYISIQSNQNFYGGLSLIDYSEFLKLFRNWVRDYEDVKEVGDSDDT